MASNLSPKDVQPELEGPWCTFAVFVNSDAILSWNRSTTPTSRKIMCHYFIVTGKTLKIQKPEQEDAWRTLIKRRTMSSGIGTSAMARAIGKLGEVGVDRPRRGQGSL